MEERKKRKEDNKELKTVRGQNCTGKEKIQNKVGMMREERKTKYEGKKEGIKENKRKSKKEGRREERKGRKAKIFGFGVPYSLLFKEGE